MTWWILIPAVIVAALTYTYWEHRTHSRRLVGLFAPFASTYGGEVKAATVLAMPQLRFERDGRQYFIGAMASGGPLVSGSASRPGFNGPFTFAELEHRSETGQELNIRRSDSLDRAARRLVDAASRRRKPTSGDVTFDNAFLIKSGDQAFVRRVLDPRLREKLLDCRHQRLEVALTRAKISVRIDDYVRSAADLDEIIAIVTLLAENCSLS